MWLDGPVGGLIDVIYGIMPFGEKPTSMIFSYIYILDKLLKAGDVTIHRWQGCKGSNWEPLG